MLTAAVIHDVVFTIVGEFFATDKLDVAVGEVINLVHVFENDARNVEVRWSRESPSWQTLHIKSAKGLENASGI